MKEETEFGIVDITNKQYAQVLVLIPVGRVSVPGLPFPGCPGFPDFFHSRIPGNGNASFPEKSGIHLVSK